MATDIGTGVLFEASTTGSGSGNYDAFLRLQKNGGEEGFNTDVNNLADNKNGTFTHSLLISDLAVIIVDGKEYYEIRLDIAETNNAGGADLTLTELRLFTSDAPAVEADFDNNFINLTEVFNLPGTLSLEDINPGNGNDDYRFLIPKSFLPDTDQYFTLYSSFSGSDSSFEEWRALNSSLVDEPAPAITIDKVASITEIDEGSTTDVTYTYTVTSQSASTDPLDITSLIDDNGTVALDDDFTPTFVDGDTDDDGLLDSTEIWTYTATRSVGPLNAGEEHTNIVTVTAEDDEGSDASDSDNATVTATDVDPSIEIIKTSETTEIDEGKTVAVTFTYAITNTSAAGAFDPLTITSLVDDNGTVETADDLTLTYVDGDDGDDLLETGETWNYTATTNVGPLNAGEEHTNIVTVTATDDEGSDASDSDNHTITGADLLPEINIEKVASLASVQAGVATPVTFTYTITNLSQSATDPLKLTALSDDMGTVATGDDVNLLTGFVSGTFHGSYYTGGDADGDYLVDTNETWTFAQTANLTLFAGETRTNIVSVAAQDDEANPVNDSDDASVTAYNLGRTPGFWSNNGSRLWDGKTDTFPKAGGLDIVNPLNANVYARDLAYGIKDLNGDGDTTDAGDSATGNRDFLMIGDWDKDGIADADENVLVIFRNDALTFLNASDKQMGDARFQLARDVVAAWLNFLGGSDVGLNGSLDPYKSAMHYIDEATAWLIETTTDHNHVLTASTLAGGDMATGKVAQSSDPWGKGFSYDGDTVKGENMLPLSGHDLGYNYDLAISTGLDIMAGSAIHSGLDYYNNHGFIL